MKTIALTQGYVAKVDDADYESVSAFNWCVAKSKRKVYAKRGIARPGGGRTVQYLHRFLMPDVGEVDHVDGDGLNNCRGNLRGITHKQNVWGFQQKRLGAASKYRGVGWDARLEKWRAQITADGKQHHLGMFSDEKRAARAYDAAARTSFGRFAHLNFPG